MLDTPIHTLIPHQGRMCLWQEIRAFDTQRVRLASRSHLAADNPLRRNGQLRAIHLCEYGAQAIAVHGGLLASTGTPPRRGFLVALRGVDIHCPRLDTFDDALIGEAELLLCAEHSQQYQFHIHCQGRLLAQGRAAVMLQA